MKKRPQMQLAEAIFPRASHDSLSNQGDALNMGEEMARGGKKGGKTSGKKFISIGGSRLVQVKKQMKRVNKGNFF